uniref:Uncharacterized protein n=2 Tax=Knipowitschia caucasica TaxID=637954 RepID=A0AAV2KTM0_KNICA
MAPASGDKTTTIAAAGFNYRQREREIELLIVLLPPEILHTSQYGPDPTHHLTKHPTQDLTQDLSQDLTQGLTHVEDSVLKAWSPRRNQEESGGAGGTKKNQEEPKRIRRSRRNQEESGGAGGTKKNQEEQEEPRRIRRSRRNQEESGGVRGTRKNQEVLEEPGSTNAFLEQHIPPQPLHLRNKRCSRRRGRGLALSRVLSPVYQLRDVSKVINTTSLIICHRERADILNPTTIEPSCLSLIIILRMQPLARSSASQCARPDWARSQPQQRAHSSRRAGKLRQHHHSPSEAPVGKETDLATTGEEQALKETDLATTREERALMGKGLNPRL